jgi:Skp family chaperone for outer membrane proteins
MKLSNKIIFYSLMLLTTISQSKDTDGSTQIATVSITKISTESEYSKDIQAKIQTDRKSFEKSHSKEIDEIKNKEKSIQEKQKQLQSLEKELNSKSSLLKDEVKAEKEFEIARIKQEIEDDIISFQRSYKKIETKMQTFEQTLSKKYQPIMMKVDEDVKKIINKYAKENNIKIVFAKEQVLYSDDLIEITDKIITLLNEKYKKDKENKKDKSKETKSTKEIKK